MTIIEKIKELGILILIQVIFLALKVANVLNWSWLVIFIPMYLEISLVVLYIIIYSIVLQAITDIFITGDVKVFSFNDKK